MNVRRGASFVVILALLSSFAVGCATTGLVGQRATQGGIYGAGLGAAAGYILGGGKGAAAGALLGAGTGAVIGGAIGTAEAKAIYAEPQPLPWIQGKRVAVVGSPHYGYGVDVSRPVVEDQLRRRGAEIVNRPTHTYGQIAETDYIVEVSAIEKGGGVIMDLRVINPAARVVAIGSATQYYGAHGYGYSGDYRVESLRAAAKNAVWALH